MDRSDPELIEARVAAARQELTARLGALERRVVGAVDDATESVRQTAHAVQSSVSGMADNVRGLYQTAADAARTALDIRGHVREHPWPSVGVAALLGLAATFFPGRSRTTAPPRASESGSSLHYLFNLIERELVGIGETAVAAASRAVKQNIQTFAETAQRGLAGNWAEGYDRPTAASNL